MAKLTSLQRLALLADDDIDLTTEEGRDEWVRLHMQRHNITLEDAKLAYASLVKERLAAGSSVASRRISHGS